MAFSSSPVVYPPSSSPPIESSPSKKRAATEEGQPRAKKRLFGTALWDAANIMQAETGEQKKVPDEKAVSQGIAKITEAVKPSAAQPEVQSSITSGSGTRAAFQTPRLHGRDEPSATKTMEPNAQHEATEDAPTWSFSRVGATDEAEPLRCRTTSGKQFVLYRRKPREAKTFERTIAERSTTAQGRATTSYYGVDIHNLIDEAQKLAEQPREEPVAPAETVAPTVEESRSKRRNRHAMWTEKYRARKFVDLVGDERTHRSVLRWLKGWDSIVFPGAAKPLVKGEKQEDEEPHRKILLLTGPPGLGKTTLAHVCAKQAGYEVVEINASDERSREVVKGRIRDCVGTENVRGINKKNGDATVRKAGRPVCVVVDEVDGVVTGSGSGGEGGFTKALIDLIQLDQKNSQRGTEDAPRKSKKGDRFRLLRPMILICNDVYHPSLRPLRSSGLAEIVHVRKAALDKVVGRLKGVFDHEGVPADNDAVRRLCEATWGVSSRKDDEAARSAGEGDLRGVLVVGEWAARKLRASARTGSPVPRLTRQWVEQNMLADLSAAGSGARGIGRGGTKETADRVFLENAGFSRSATRSTTNPKANGSGTAVNSVSDASRANAMALLRSAIETTGEADRILNDVFSAYPSRPFQDDTFLSKPNAASEWLHFHDMLSSRVYASQEWELAPYLSTPILGFHSLFGSTNKFNAHAHASADPQDEPSPFSGPRADFEASEATRATRSSLQALHAGLTLPLFRAFRSPEHLATDLVPHLAHLLAPNVSPVIIGGSSGARGTASVRREGERAMVERAASAMAATGVSFEKARVEDARGANGGFVLRMEPPIDVLAEFATYSAGAAPARYAIRQVLDVEHAKLIAQQQAAARQARFAAGRGPGGENAVAEPATGASAAQAAVPASLLGGKSGAEARAGRPPSTSGPVKRDFFGRPIACTADSGAGVRVEPAKNKATTWVTFHEGFSNAVRKPVGLREVLSML